MPAMKYYQAIFFILMTAGFFTSTVASADSNFAVWLEGVRVEARSKGISEQTLNDVLSSISPQNRIIKLDRKQPERAITFNEYLPRVVDKARIQKGQALMKKHAQMLSKVEKEYGVPKEVIVALWGIETSYGKNMGGFYVPEALATLAYDGRRSEFFRGELLQALEIVNQKQISASKMMGSWAGAMGQSQFMPSSYLKFAVDYDKDGKKDIWNSLPDVFASIANYLHESGWQFETGIYEPAKLIEGFEIALEEDKKPRSLNEWRENGAFFKEGMTPESDTNMRVVIPDLDFFSEEMDGSWKPWLADDHNAKAYLVYSNYEVLLDWNRSNYFALSVGYLARQLEMKAE